MIDSNVARRYARALLALAGNEAGNLTRTAEQLTAVAQGFANSPARSLLSPGAPRAQQKAMVEALGGKLEGAVKNLLELLIDRNRFDGLVEIAHAFAQQVDEKLGRVRAVVKTASPLSDSELAKVGEKLGQATGKQISVSAQVDPALLGGVAADVGGVLYDGSLRTQLETLRQELKA